MTEPMTPTDQQIRFRPIGFVTARRLAPLRNDAVVQEHVRNPGLVSSDEQVEWFRWLMDHKDTQRMVAIEHDIGGKRDDVLNKPYGWQLIGCGGMTHISWIDRRAELSVYTVPCSWEHEAARLLIEWGFDELGLHRIEAETLTPQRGDLCAALGFQNEGVRRAAYWRRGEYVNADQWGLLADEWERE